MANLEVNAASSVCRKCGRAYGRLKGYFPICYAYLYKGVGYLPYCSDCCKNMFDAYYAECGDERNAIHQMCRKLDLYWSDELYEKAAGKTGTRTVLQNYIARLNNAQYAGLSYDDTLREEKRMWLFGSLPESFPEPEEVEDAAEEKPVSIADIEPIEITEDIISFWGPGYTREMYQELEQRLRYYTSQMDDASKMDMGTEALLRQIAMMEIDINKARADGRAVDKMVNSLNSLLSSLNKPQKSTAADTAAANTPFGVWIKRWEDERPLPEIDESMKDVDGIVKYVLTWVYGHLAHMLKIKNARTPLYDDAIARLRVDHPEYDEEDDESMLYDLFGDGDGDAGAED